MANGNDNGSRGQRSGVSSGSRSRSSRSGINILSGDSDSDSAGVVGQNSSSGNGTASDTRNAQQSRGFDPDIYGSGRAGAGAGSHRSNRSDSGRDSGNDLGTERTDEDEIAVRSPAPRKVRESSLGGNSSKRSKKSDPASAELFAQLWGIAYAGVSMSTKDENWKLQEDDAQELGENTAKLINSMDQRKASKWLRRLEKWQPGLALMFSVVAITQPRIAHTRALRQQGKKPHGNIPEEKPRATEQRPAPSASPQAVDVRDDGGIREGVEFRDASPIDRNTGLPGFSGSSVSREMGSELFGKDAGGEV